ncbi:MAG: non-homologous end-joining DNA ligase [Bacillus sp. (in: firmicutes)]
MPIEITNPDKLLWPEKQLSKRDYIAYLIKISPFLLPFLHNRLLTVIRFPDGAGKNSFFQKGCPKYAPDFVETVHHEDTEFIVCNSVYTLCWLGNQAALEFHIPFQRIGETIPYEIVFDLDPPSENHFHLAIKAATEIHKILSKFQITGYPKLSGNKGIQVHIPLGNTKITYEDARVFTSFVAEYLVEQFPDLFTTERLKKNRGDRLYIDYVQHAEGKTLIAPYSTRGNPHAQVAAPLYWKEVNKYLSPASYTIRTITNRLSFKKCPFSDYFNCDNRMIVPVIRQLKNSK